MQGIYIHIPFCVKKCSYCDFLSGPSGEAGQTRYIEALCEEMRLRLDDAPCHPETLFIGGGTPSLLSAENWQRLLAALQHHLDLSALREWTIEANPGTINPTLLTLWRDAGVNRLSFGVQSFDAATLRMLGRIHTAEEAIAAVELARSAGFSNISLDLMYGLPGMTMTTWRQTVEQALALQPTHLSLYGLIIEDGTPIAAQIDAGILPEPDDDLAAAACEWHTARLQRAGFTQYEVSNFALPGFACRHNQLYWRLEPWLGFGVGATGWMPPTLCSNGTDLDVYCRSLENGVLPPATVETWTEREYMSETIIMGLRMNEGISLTAFQRRFGRAVEALWPGVIDRCVSEGLLRCEGERLFSTDRGRLLGNIVAERFL